MNNGQSHPGEPSKFVKAAKNETWLFSFRITALGFGLTTSVLGFLATNTLADIKSSIADIRRDVSTLDRRYNDDRVAIADRVGRVEGQVGELKGSVETHRRRLDDGDTNSRAIWQRLFEVGRAPPRPNNP